MRLTVKELATLINALDSLQYDGDENIYKKLLEKLSNELSLRGYTTIISKHYITK